MGLFSSGKKNKEKDITEILQYQLNNNSNIRADRIVLQDVRIPDNNKIVTIELVVITKKGIITINTVNVSGIITGGQFETCWYYNNNNAKILNPINISVNNQKSLAKFLNMNRENIIPYIVTQNNTSLRDIPNCGDTYRIVKETDLYYFLGIHLSILPEIITKDEMNKYKKKLDKDTEYQNNISLFDMPKAILEASMKNIYTDDKNRLDAIKWLTTFIKKYENNENCKGLYLAGNFGCGKTYLISAMFNELAKKGVKSVTVYYPEFLRELKGRFGEDYNEVFNKVRKAPLLLLDDIGAETVTNWNRDEILGSLLQYRMQEGLPTFFTSNNTIKELEEHLIGSDSEGRVKSRRIIERIKYLTDEIIMVAENRRK